MTIRRLAALVLLAAPLTLPAQVKPGELDQALRQMDTASARFKSAEADFQWDFYELVVKETTTQHGNIFFKKNGAKLEMGAKILPQLRDSSPTKMANSPSSTPGRKTSRSTQPGRIKPSMRVS